ncbi:hypothetical protein FC14_GL000233 [Ligilactobacillus agilis DSM 20509]|uniref:Membrane protein 6-pyruvoyl-tetrahydropterin synthase-related domain-containing protein n=1 Tax=Ligilactobacillus agilis DSM 20509 TaxID=1423718 RepID=A0A0R2A8L8_9LACO|nr:hypothetical protein [Ligilactobacillus agilis]KRM63774.1 hypothetical protein FC14_GL000233 [Ligilactobacillus agilis DSM 20509]
MNAKRRELKINITITILIVIATYLDIKNNFLITGADSFFHIERVYEIREAFKAHHFPSWVNFITFHHIGQAINGMYPDISLWPLVYITNILNPVHQIIVIRSLILALTYLVTRYSISKRFYNINATYSAAIYTLSGMCLRNFNNEIQLGTAIILIFLFPIVFAIKELIYSKKIEPILIIKLSLLCTIIIYSHLMSIFVLYLIVGIFILARLIYHHSIYPIINILLSSTLLALTSLPILFRYFTISSSKIQSVYSKGNVTAINFTDIFTSASWNSRGALSLVSIILISIVLTNLEKSNLSKLTPYIYGEILILILGTNLAPWSILQNLPLLDSIQDTGWRFLIFSSAIPFILLLINFSAKTSEKILHILFVISICTSIGIYWDFHQSAQKNLAFLDKSTDQPLSINDWVKLKSSGINSENISRDIVPDYAPAQINSEVYNNGSTLSDDLQEIIFHHFIIIDGKKISPSLNYKYNQLTFQTKKSIDVASTVTLPIYNYKTLKYNVTLNGDKTTYSMSNLGFIELHNVKKLKTVSVSYSYPKLYVYLVYLSSIFILTLISLLLHLLQKHKIRNID